MKSFLAIALILLCTTFVEAKPKPRPRPRPRPVINTVLAPVRFVGNVAKAGFRAATTPLIQR